MAKTMTLARSPIARATFVQLADELLAPIDRLATPIQEQL